MGDDTLDPGRQGKTSESHSGYGSDVRQEMLRHYRELVSKQEYMWATYGTRNKNYKQAVKRHERRKRWLKWLESIPGIA